MAKIDLTNVRYKPSTDTIPNATLMFSGSRLITVIFPVLSDIGNVEYTVVGFGNLFGRMTRLVVRQLPVHVSRHVEFWRPDVGSHRK